MQRKKERARRTKEKGKEKLVWMALLTDGNGLRQRVWMPKANGDL